MPADRPTLIYHRQRAPGSGRTMAQ